MWFYLFDCGSFSPNILLLTFKFRSQEWFTKVTAGPVWEDIIVINLGQLNLTQVSMILEWENVHLDITVNLVRNCISLFYIERFSLMTYSTYRAIDTKYSVLDFTFTKFFSSDDKCSVCNLLNWIVFFVTVTDQEGRPNKIKRQKGVARISSQRKTVYILHFTNFRAFRKIIT